MVARKTRLRAVPPNARKKLTLGQAVSRTDYRAALKAMAVKIATTLEGDCPPTAVAALTKRLGDVLAEIEALDRRRKAATGEDDGSGDLDTSWDEGKI